MRFLPHTHGEFIKETTTGLSLAACCMIQATCCKVAVSQVVGIESIYALFFGPGSFRGSRDHHYPHAADYSRDVQLTQYHRDWDWDYRHLL